MIVLGSEPVAVGCTGLHRLSCTCRGTFCVLLSPGSSAVNVFSMLRSSSLAPVMTMAADACAGGEASAEQVVDMSSGTDTVLARLHGRKDRAAHIAAVYADETLLEVCEGWQEVTTAQERSGKAGCASPQAAEMSPVPSARCADASADMTKPEC